MRLEELLEELSKEISPIAVKLDNQGLCQITLNKSAVVALEKSSDNEGFYIYTAVGIIPQEKEKKISLDALSGNLFGKETGKASLGYVPNTNTLVLFRYILEEGLTYTAFRKLLEEFFAYLKIWHEKVETIKTESESLAQNLHLSKAGNLVIFFA